VLNEGAAIDPDATYRLDAVHAPILVIHARDDAINPVAVSERIAAEVDGAELDAINQGGHLLLGAHPHIRARLASFFSADGPP